VTSIAIAAGVVVVASLLAHTPQREEPDSVLFEAGRFDPIKNVKQATSFGVEYHIDKFVWWGVRPFVGAGLTSDRSAWGYGGIRYATEWGEHVVITPSFAVGGYSQGHGKDLGHPPVLGRSGLNLEYRFGDDMRIGAAYYHMSNGKLLNQTNNPGTEIIGLTFSISIR
jgi:lipid A 3-O-deacylase